MKTLLTTDNTISKNILREVKYDKTANAIVDGTSIDGQNKFAAADKFGVYL